MKNFNIINELLSYHIKKEPISFLIPPFETLGKEKLDILVKNILLWQKIIHTSPTMANRGKVINKEFYLLEDDMIINDYKSFFDVCPELNEFFYLKNNRIILNTDLSKKEVDKLRIIIDEGYELSMKINIGKSMT